MRPVFISGIGTGVGKTVVAAIIAESLRADYWKPVQAGLEDGTDSTWIASVISNPDTVIHPETYKLKLAASPHLAAARENIYIQTEVIHEQYRKIKSQRPLVIEGAGGLMVPLNEKEFVIDLIKKLDALVVLVSRNYLGSINHSLMTARICHSEGIRVAGWVFNDLYMDYTAEIAAWSGYPSLFALPLLDSIDPITIREAAERFRTTGNGYLYSLL